MGYHVHIYDDATRSDLVLPIRDFLRFAEDNEMPDDVVHALIDAAAYERIAEHHVSRGRFSRTAWNIAADPNAGSLPANTWRSIGIRAVNRFNTAGADGWSYRNDSASHFVVRQSGWYDIDTWFRGSVSVPAVPLYLITSVHLAYRITRAVTTPQAYLQLSALDTNSDVAGTSSPNIQELGDTYAPFSYVGGPPVANPTYIKGWGLTGADTYPLYAGDIIELIWQFKGGGPIDFLDNLEARITLQRIEDFFTKGAECCS